MPTANKKRTLVIAAVCAVIGVSAGVAVALWPKDPPPKDETADDDTGMSRRQTEAMMREIGYVQ